METRTKKRKNIVDDLNPTFNVGKGEFLFSHKENLAGQFFSEGVAIVLLNVTTDTIALYHYTARQSNGDNERLFQYFCNQAGEKRFIVLSKQEGYDNFSTISQSLEKKGMVWIDHHIFKTKEKPWSLFIDAKTKIIEIKPGTELLPFYYYALQRDTPVPQWIEKRKKEVELNLLKQQEAQQQEDQRKKLIQTYRDQLKQQMTSFIFDENLNKLDVFCKEIGPLLPDVLANEGKENPSPLLFLFSESNKYISHCAAINKNRFAIIKKLTEAIKTSVDMHTLGNKNQIKKIEELLANSNQEQVKQFEGLATSINKEQVYTSCVHAYSTLACTIGESSDIDSENEAIRNACLREIKNLNHAFPEKAYSLASKLAIMHSQFFSSSEKTCLLYLADSQHAEAAIELRLAGFKKTDLIKTKHPKTLHMLLNFKHAQLIKNYVELLPSEKKADFRQQLLQLSPEDLTFQLHYQNQFFQSKAYSRPSKRVCI